MSVRVYFNGSAAAAFAADTFGSMSMAVESAANRFIIILPSLNSCSLSYVVTVSVVSTGTNSVCTAADVIILSTAV